MSDPAARITLAEFNAMLRDIRVPDADIARFLTGDPDRSRPFDPALRPDPARVVMSPASILGAESGGFLMALNGTARFRRQLRFRQADEADPRPVIVAEGDSWLQFPFLLDDIVDQLDSDFRVFCVAAAGDTLSNMVIQSPEYLAALAEPGTEQAGTLLFSGTGNDFLGEENGVSVIPTCVLPFTAGLSAEAHIETPGFRLRRDFVRETLTTLLRTMADAFPGRRVVLVGYDYVRPHEGPGDPREDRIYARRDGFLARPLRDERGITDPTLRRNIVAAMVDVLHGILADLCGGNHGQGAFPFAWHADLRNTLPDLANWNDEIHPTDEGFGRIAARISPLLA